MAFHKSLCFFISIFITFLSSSHANTFEVGNRDGWTLHPSENYNQWSGRLRFLINDTLHFKYNGGSDSVLVVNKGDYDNCNGNNPISRLDGGDSSFKFDRSGPFYVITGNKSNCDQGQKLIVVVLAVRNRSPPPAVATPPTPISPSPSAGTPISPSPAAGTPISPSPAAGTPISPSPAAGTPISPSPAAVSPGSPSPAAVSPESPPSVTPSLTPPASSPAGGSSSSPGGATGESPAADVNSPPPAGSSARPALSGSTIVTVILALWWFY